MVIYKKDALVPQRRGMAIPSSGKCGHGRYPRERGCLEPCVSAWGGVSRGRGCWEGKVIYSKKQHVQRWKTFLVGQIWILRDWHVDRGWATLGLWTSKCKILNANLTECPLFPKEAACPVPLCSGFYSEGGPSLARPSHTLPYGMRGPRNHLEPV